MALVAAARRHASDSDAAIAVWVARDGRQVSVRPLGAAALEPFAAFVRGLSIASSSQRFLAPVRDLSDEAASRLVSVDQSRRVAWIAEEHSAPGVIVAEVRYAITAPGEAEIALAVADDWQRSGLGSFLLHRLLEHASRARITCAWGSVRSDNDAAITVARRFGFDVSPDLDDPALLKVVRSLPLRAVVGSPARTPFSAET